MKPNLVAALVLCVLVQLPIAAQSGPIYRDGGVTAFTRKVIGVTRGDTLRYTWANLNDPNDRKRRLEPLSIQVTVLDADGSVIAQANAEAPAPGKLQQFDFRRDQFRIDGEPGTGRLEVRVEVRVLFNRVAKIDAFALKQKVQENFPGAFEVFDGTGRTQLHSDVATLLVFEFDGE